MLRLMIFYLTLAAALFAPGVFARNDVTSQNGVTATGLFKSIAVSWTNTCAVCSWQLSTKYNNDPWVIHAVLPKGVTQYTILNLRPGQEYRVKMDAKRTNRWVNRALFTNMTGKLAEDGTILKQIIFFGRHGIRSAAFPNVPPKLMMLGQYAYQPYPDSDFKVHWGYLTLNGQKAAKLFGSYFNKYLLQEGLLTGDPTTDLSHSYFRANSIQRSNITAAKFGQGLIPAVPPSDTTIIPVHSYRLGNPNDPKDPVIPDPVFDPIAKSVEMNKVVPHVGAYVDLHLDPARAVREAEGIYGNYADVLSLISKVLYSPPEKPTMLAGTPSPLPPPVKQYPQGSLDPTTQPFILEANPVVPIPPPVDLPPRAITKAGGFIYLGGLDSTNTSTDPFVMQYTDGFTLNKVAWGRLPSSTSTLLDSLSQTTRLVTLQIDIEMRLPYVSQVQSSNAASHVLRTMSQARYGSSGSSGVFGDGNSEIKVITSSDYYVSGLAGLLGLTWTLPGYQKDYIPPDGTLVFELRKSKISKAYLVRVFYYAQTFDQLRNQTVLSLGVPPEQEQLKFGTSDEISFDAFNTLLSQKIDQQYVQPFSQVPPPGVLTGVPLQ